MRTLDLWIWSNLVNQSAGLVLIKKASNIEEFSRIPKEDVKDCIDQIILLQLNEREHLKAIVHEYSLVEVNMYY